MEKEKKKVDIIKILSSISLYVMIALIIVTVLAVFNYIKLNANIFLAMAIFSILCVGWWMAMPWARRIKDKKSKIVSIVFLILLLICCLLLIAEMCIFVNLYKEVGSDSFEFSSTNLTIIRWTLLIVVQFLVASSVANTVIKYKKEQIMYQVIRYISLALIDIYVVGLFFMMRVEASIVSVIALIAYMFASPMAAMLIIGLLILLITGIYGKNYEKKKVGIVIESQSGEPAVSDAKSTKSSPNRLEAKLAKLKALKDSGVLTDKEYNEKRKEIIKEYKL